MHLVALWIYVIHERQSQYLALVLDAREQWRDGHLDAAADRYRRYVTDYPDFSWPVVLFHNYPTRSRAWYALGRVEESRGSVEAALAAYAEAMREEPGLGQHEFRNLLLEQGRHAQLRASATARLALDSEDLAAWRDLGAAELAAGRAPAAAEAYAHALDQLPLWLARHTHEVAGKGLTIEEAGLRELLSVAELTAGQADRAQRECDEIRARERPQDHREQLCRAYLAAAAGDAAGARAALKGYLPPAPEHERLVRALQARLDGAAAPTG